MEKHCVFFDVWTDILNIFITILKCHRFKQDGTSSRQQMFKKNVCELCHLSTNCSIHWKTSLRYKEQWNDLFLKQYGKRVKSQANRKIPSVYVAFVTESAKLNHGLLPSTISWHQNLISPIRSVHYPNNKWRLMKATVDKHRYTTLDPSVVVLPKMY